MTDDPSHDDRNTGTFAALMGLAVACFFLIGLAALVMPQVLGLVAVVAVFGGAVAFHYVAWGWWLPRVLKDDSESSGDESPSSPRASDK
jgi:hypothetical protein